LINLARVVGDDQSQPDHALQILEIAEGAVLRAGASDALRGGLWGARSLALRTKGEFAAAKDAAMKERDYIARAFGADDPRTLFTIADLAIIVQAQGENATAVALQRDVLAKLVSQLGPEHPRVAAMLNNLGSSCLQAGEVDAAADYMHRCLDIYLKTHSVNTVSVARAWMNLGAVETARGQFDAAIVAIQRGREIAQKILGPEDLQVATMDLFLGAAKRKQGKHREAFESLNRALAINVKSLGPEHPDVAYAAEALGSVFQARGDLGNAFTFHRRALEIRRKVLDKDHPSTLTSSAEVAEVLARSHRCLEARPLLETAITGFEKAARTGEAGFQLALAMQSKCDLERGAAAQAVAGLERAITLSENAKADRVGRGQYRWVLVRALWALGRRDEAIAAARQAERELAADADGAIDRAAVRAWLAAHAGAAGASKPAAPPRAP